MIVSVTNCRDSEGVSGLVRTAPPSPTVKGASLPCCWLRDSRAIPTLGARVSLDPVQEHQVLPWVPGAEAAGIQGWAGCVLSRSQGSLAVRQSVEFRASCPSSGGHSSIEPWSHTGPAASDSLGAVRDAEYQALCPEKPGRGCTGPLVTHSGKLRGAWPRAVIPNVHGQWGHLRA